MKNLSRLTVLLPALFAAATASAGDRVGNGGSSWVCRVGTAIQWASLTDIYEARHELGLPIVDKPGVAPEQLRLEAETRIFRANIEFYRELLPHLEQVVRSFRVLDGSHGLTPISDVLPRIFPKPESCPGGEARLEQLANFTPTGELIVDREIWERLPEVDQAALVVHEAIYGLLRDRQAARDSRLARRLTGFVFSTVPFAAYAAEFRLPPAPDEPGWTRGRSNTSLVQVSRQGKRVRVAVDNREGRTGVFCKGVITARSGGRIRRITIRDHFGKFGISALAGQRVIETFGWAKPVTGVNFQGTCSVP